MKSLSRETWLKIAAQWDNYIPCLKFGHMIKYWKIEYEQKFYVQLSGYIPKRNVFAIHFSHHTFFGSSDGEAI